MVATNGKYFVLTVKGMFIVMFACRSVIFAAASKSGIASWDGAHQISKYAMNSSGAELIVNPQYVTVVKGGLLIKTYTVDVTGYKGTISSIEDLGPGQ